MKILGMIFLYVGLFMIPVGVVYGFMTGFDEWAGFPALLVTGLMCLLGVSARSLASTAFVNRAFAGRQVGSPRKHWACG